MTAPKRRSGAAAQGVVLYPVPEAADRLGSGVTHVYRLIDSGQLAAVDIAQPGAKKSKTRIRSDDLEAYIEARTRRVGACA